MIRLVRSARFSIWLTAAVILVLLAPLISAALPRGGSWIAVSEPLPIGTVARPVDLTDPLSSPADLRELTLEPLIEAGMQSARSSGQVAVKVTVRGSNTPPVLAPIGARSVNEGSRLTFTARATDADRPANTLTYSLVGAPQGAVINATTGAFSWTPTEVQGPGTHTFTVKVADGKGGTATETITVQVAEVNAPPVLAPIGARSVNEGSRLTFTARATDADRPANTLTYSLVGAPQGAVINATTGAFSWTPTEVQGPGTHTFTVKVADGKGGTATETITVQVRRVTRVAGQDRYGTALQASSEFTSAGTVVIATGMNWPDALGGTALAGAVRGPLLLTRTNELSDTLRAEIVRLGARKVYVLGGGGAVAPAVETGLRKMGLTVVRLGGVDRYATGRLVADETIRVLGGTYSGDALVATGTNFPDATGGSALAAALGRPILLVKPSGEVYVPAATRRVTILGGTGAVSSQVQAALQVRLGAQNVVRAGGIDRYETAAKVAQVGIDAGMTWDGVGIATGADFPDALSGGAMLGARRSVLLLSRPATLDGFAEARLLANAQTINRVHIFGGSAAISVQTETGIRRSTGIF